MDEGKSLKLLCIQETHQTQNAKIQRKEFMLYFNGENELNPNHTSGVAIIVHNIIQQNILDIEPISDRLMTLTIAGTPPLQIVTTHCPHAIRDTVEKQTHWEALTRVYRKLARRGPTVLVGDMNARVQRPTNAREREVVGAYGFEAALGNPLDRSEVVVENRELLITLCIDTRSLLHNTYFKKQENKLATYRNIGIQKQDPIT